MATAAGSHSLFCTDGYLRSVQGKKEHVVYDAITPLIRRNVWKGESGSILAETTTTEPSVFLVKHKGCISINKGAQKQKYCMITKAMMSEKHLNSLNSYLEKLHDDVKKPSSKSLNGRTESIDDIDELNAENGLRSLESFLDKAKGFQSKNYIDKDIYASVSTSRDDQPSGRERSLKNYMESNPGNSEGNEIAYDEASDFYIIGALASINIAVFLFEIAAPVKSSYFELVSLPMVYGAKINDLILMGEWWRLVTPMFLHSGILHIAIGIWALFTFGLQVSRVYGSFTFLLIYVLGGISGNITSFLHTAEPTVGGTDPVFAIIGAWLIYQVQNRDVTTTNAYKKMFQGAIVTTALICILSNFTPIDDWAHFGAAYTGIAYGYFTCPTIQVKDASSAAGRQDRIGIVQRFADPCRSLMYFSIFVFLLSCLLLVIEPPVELI